MAFVDLISADGASANKAGKTRLARFVEALVRQGFSVDMLKERLDAPLLSVCRCNAA